MSISLDENVDGFFILAYPLGRTYKWIGVNSNSGYPSVGSFLNAHNFHTSKDAREYLRSFKDTYPQAEIIKIKNLGIEYEVVANSKGLNDYEAELAQLNKRYGIE